MLPSFTSLFPQMSQHRDSRQGKVLVWSLPLVNCLLGLLDASGREILLSLIGQLQILGKVTLGLPEVHNGSSSEG